jgi:hypothetical protein
MTTETRELQRDEFYLAEHLRDNTMARRRIQSMKGSSGFLLTGNLLHPPGT